MITRRILLRYGLLAAGIGLAGPIGRRAEADDIVCAKPYAGDKAQRDGLHYVEHSGNPVETCDTCQYFEPRGSCGNCRIVGTLVNPVGTCDSWSRKGG